jgi:hypothetical protein
MNGQHTSKEDLIKEFNLNYKNYLENLILYQSINEIINDKKSKIITSNSSSINSNNSSINERLVNRFWKSQLLININLNDYLTKFNNTENDFLATSFLSSTNSFSATTAATSNTSQNDYLVSQFQIDDFNDELKNEMINEIELYCENYLNKIENMMKNDLDDFDDETNRSVALTKKIKEISYSNELNLKQILKLHDDIRVKVKNYYNLTHEILNLLIKLVNEFKLDFFTNKDLVTLDSLLASCDMLIAKTETILGECLNDTYSSDKLKCLNIIKENIELLSLKYKEKYDNVKNALKMYRSLGPDFEKIHKTYIQLKEKLDSRKWTLNKIKNDFIN